MLIYIYIYMLISESNKEHSKVSGEKLYLAQTPLFEHGIKWPNN